MPLTLGGLLLTLPAVAQTPAPPTPNDLGPPPSVTVTFGLPGEEAPLSGSLSHASADHVHLDYGGELTINAAHLDGDLLHSVYDATGGVYAHAHDTTLHADQLHVEGMDRLGFTEGAVLTRRPFTIRAPRIDFRPDRLVATHASVTTARPEDKPDVELRVGTLTVTPAYKAGQPQVGRENIVLRDASLYLLHNHILTVPRLTTSVGAQAADPNRRRGASPTVGYSGRYGVFVGYGSSTKIGAFPLRYSLIQPLHGTTQFRLTSTQELFAGPPPRPEVPPPPVAPARPHDYLAALRALTTAPRPLLPEGDPLLFHDILPNTPPIHLFDDPTRAGLYANEEVSYHIEATGRGRNDLFVTRSPEVSLSGTTPLTRVFGRPAPDDPVAFRRYLRRFTLYANAAVDLGQYSEAPTGIRAARQQYSLGLSPRPLLVASNTVLLPGVTYTTNRYSGIGPFHSFSNMSGQYLGSDSGRSFSGDSFSYVQAYAALNHYFSPFSAVGAQYIMTQKSGDSPFNFDVPDTTRELDGRAQFGSQRFTYGGSLRYDLVHPHVIDYTLAVAPALHGFTPVFSYSFFSRAIGVGIEIPGLTF